MIETKSNFLKIGGFDFHYEVFEGVVDQDTLMIHGNLACNMWWYPTVQELQKRNPSTQKKGKLVLADWRGCGLSKGLKSETDVDFYKFSEDYLHLIEHLHLKNICVVGHSTGGLIGMLAILKQPEKFNSLVLLDSIGALGIESPIPVDQILSNFKMMSENETISNMAIGATIQGVDQESNYFKTLAKATFEVDKPIWLGVPRRLCLETDITDQMKNINLPTLILHGENDMVLPSSGSVKLSEQIKNSKLKILKNQGHSLNVENPKLFVEELNEFWSSLETI